VIRNIYLLVVFLSLFFGTIEWTQKSLKLYAVLSYSLVQVPHGGFFLQFCDVVAVATIHKRKEPNLATGQKGQ
jgi:hypothetical protein